MNPSSFHRRNAMADTVKFQRTKNLLLLICTILCVNALNGMDPTSLCELRRTEQEPSYATLPKEVKQVIFFTALTASKNFDEKFNVFKNTCALHGIHYHHEAILTTLATQLPDQIDQAANEVKHLQGTTLKHFITLIDVIAKKFPNWPREWIANKFKTQIAGRYNTLGPTFLKTVGKEENSETALKNAFNLLNDDLDPNYSWIGHAFSISDNEWITRIKTLLHTAYDKIFATPSIHGLIYNYHNNVHEDMLPILTLLLNRGAKPIPHLMQHVRWVANEYPTDFNSALLHLLEQANTQNY